VTVFILGGGPAGLAIADGLIDETDAPFVLIDQAPALGGLARTVHWDGVGDHDLGPHKIFTLDQGLRERVEALLPPGSWLTRDKVSSIYMQGHYLDYPPSPLSLAAVFGTQSFAGMVMDYGVARLKALGRAATPATFEDDLVARLGRRLYEVLFRPIALKLWGDPPTLDVKLSRGRVQTPSLAEIALRILKLQKSSQFEALTFRYPRGGLGRLWAAIEAKGREGDRFARECSVRSFEVEGDRIDAIDCVKPDTGATVRFAVDDEDFVASTLPLSLLVHLLRGHLDEEVVAAARSIIALNDLLLVFFHVDVPSLLDDSWVFVPDPQIVFHRISEQESFDPDMVPCGSIVCCEIMSNELRPMSAQSDEHLVDEAKRGLADMGITHARILGHRVIRLPKSYPVFRAGYEEGLKTVLAALDRFSNLRTVGRQGAFNYIGTLDAMDIGYGFARWYSSQDRGPWQAERERTSHYPVLD
jgi:protoporphyrinogen oxidase